jgi:hypothetical protein
MAVNREMGNGIAPKARAHRVLLNPIRTRFCLTPSTLRWSHG